MVCTVRLKRHKPPNQVIPSLHWGWLTEWVIWVDDVRVVLCMFGELEGESGGGVESYADITYVHNVVHSVQYMRVRVRVSLAYGTLTLNSFIIDPYNLWLTSHLTLVSFLHKSLEEEVKGHRLLINSIRTYTYEPWAGWRYNAYIHCSHLQRLHTLYVVFDIPPIQESLDPQTLPILLPRLDPVFHLDSVSLCLLASDIKASSTSFYFYIHAPSNVY